MAGGGDAMDDMLRMSGGNASAKDDAAIACEHHAKLQTIGDANVRLGIAVTTLAMVLDDMGLPAIEGFRLLRAALAEP